ncbi:MAG: HEAT repeat domain-containing protein [Pseudomonadales bacterium]|nr:HEAT repeat domain-containing protein [Pseudomonadales bacterium]
MDELHFQRIKNKIKEIPDMRESDGDYQGVTCFYRGHRIVSELVENFKKESFFILKDCIVSDNKTLIESGYSGLGQLASKEAIDLLISTYNSEKDAHHKYLLAITLGRINKDASNSFLISLIETEKDPEVLSKIEFILTQIDPENTDMVEKGLNSMDGFTRHMALQSIIENDPAHLTIEQYLEFTRDPYGDVRGEAFKQIVTYNRKEDLALFYDALFDNNWHVASSAYKYLSKNIKTITPEIKDAIKQGGGANFKRAIIQFLKAVKEPDAIPVLVDMLINERSNERRFNMILSAIKSYKKVPGAAEGIFKLLKDQGFDTEAGQCTRYDLWEALVDMKATRLIPDIQDYVKNNPVDSIHSETALEKLENI